MLHRDLRSSTSATVSMRVFRRSTSEKNPSRSSLEASRKTGGLRPPRNEATAVQSGSNDSARTTSPTSADPAPAKPTARNSSWLDGTVEQNLKWEYNKPAIRIVGRIHSSIVALRSAASAKV